jgi:hypothetical protein
MSRSTGARWLAVPTGFSEAMARAGLTAEHRALIYAAWDYAARERTDGLLTRDELQRLAGFKKTLLQPIVAAGYLDESGDRYRIVGYLDLNITRAEIESFIGLQRAKATLGGRASGTARGAGGRFTGPGTDPAGPSHRPGGLVTTDPKTDPATDPPYPYPYTNTNTYQGTRVGDDAVWVGFGPAWAEFREAWTARGFRLPPTEAQQLVLWPIVDARPEDSAAWVTEAPGRSASEVVGHVLDRFRELRAQVDARAAGEEHRSQRERVAGQPGDSAVAGEEPTR